MTPHDLTELLNRLINGWENEVVEFKTASNQFDSNKTGAYVSALSNEANLRGEPRAWLIFGVSNDRKIVGTNHLATTESRQALKQQVQQGIDQGLTVHEIHELDVDGKRAVLLEIPAAPRGMPISWKGDYRARAGESLSPLSLDKLDAIRAQTLETDWTAVVVPEATINHLDPVALNRARQGFTERYAARIPASDIGAWDDATFLAKARLTRDGKLTRAAILLLGANTSSHLLNPHPAQLTWKLVGQEEAYEHFRTPFLLNATALANRIRNVQIRLLPPNELIYREISKYDERSLLEALYNAIAHQDYTKNARVIVTEYVDRLTFISTGNFYDGDPDDYRLADRTPGQYRNPFLVEAMHELHLIDQMGYGIHRMVQDQVRRFLPLPDYDLSRQGEVKLTLPGAVIDRAYSQLLMVRSDLPLEVVLALDHIQKGLPISSQAITNLKRAKLIEGRKPHYRVSAQVAAATDSKVAYIRTRAQDDEHYTRLLTDYLEKFGEASRQEINDLLWSKLSEALNDQQKHNKITNLLSKLRVGGVIQNTGSRKNPKWVLRDE